MASLYELTESMKLVYQLMEEGTLEDSVLDEVFKNTEEELNIKLEGYCKFIKNLESDIKGLKAEEERLAAKRSTLENTIERSKEAMERALRVSGNRKMECGTFTVYMQNNPPKCVIDTELANIPGKYLVQQEPKIDKKMLLNDLKSGEEGLEEVAHIEQGESLRIK